jgi:GMP synthase (glutamine-hydrolysing)
MSAKPVLIIQNHPIETPGRIADFLESRKISFDPVHPYRGDTLPDPQTLAAVITLGCPESVAKFQQNQWSIQLFDYLDDIVDTETPYLGICYGSQLMAANRGAAVLPNDQKEIGVYDVTLNDTGKADPIFAGFPETFPVFHWHGDTFDIPEGATKLAGAATCANQVFRIGKCYGVQFHLEADSEKLPIWLKEYANELADVAKTAEQVMTEFKNVEAETSRLSDLLVANFLESQGALKVAVVE